MGRKRSRGEVGAVEVSDGDTGAGDVELAGHAGGYGFAAAIEYVDAQVGDGYADDAACTGVDVGLGDLSVGRVDGGFGGAVHIDQSWRGVAIAVDPGFEDVQLERFADEHDVAQGEGGRRTCAVGVDQGAERGWGLAQHRDVFALQQLVEGGRVAAGVVGDHHDAAAGRSAPQISQTEMSKE